MANGFEFLISGILLGLTAGVSPGPLLALVFSETLMNGRIEGIKVAVAPLITDLPIVLLALLILSNLVQNSLVIAVISLFGACYLIYLGIENLRVKVDKVKIETMKKDALKRGIIANFLSPSPYLFWLSIGGPIVFRSLEIGASITFLFVFGFYSLLIGSKVAIALIVDKFKSLVKSKYHVYIVRVLGAALILFALIFVREALGLIGLF